MMDIRHRRRCWRRGGGVAPSNRWRFIMEASQSTVRQRVPWNKGKLVGQKAPFKPKGVWAIRARMEQQHRTRELALFNLGIEASCAVATWSR
jgi:hypothetical protein